MSLPCSGDSTSASNWTCRLLAVLLIAGAAAAHLFYLASPGALELSPDEAHYWDWSRHLDWSYYSKGPLVAYLIRGGCALAGPWAEEHTGSLMFAIRLPAVLCGTLLLVAVYLLVMQVYGRDRLALGAVLAALTLPLVTAGSSLMTIDSPYVCLWAWALVIGHRAVFRNAWWAWVVTGLLVGLGILAKYTMVIWIPSVGLFLLFTPAFRPLLFRRGFWLMVIIAGLCCLPILIWNAQHDWVTFRHVFTLAGLVKGSKGPSKPLNWFGPLIYVGLQCAMLMIFWFVVWVHAMITHRPTVESDPGIRYLWWMSLPMFVLFLGFSPKTDGGEMNWPVTAYVSGLVLAAGWLERQLWSSNFAWRVWMRSTLAVTLLAGTGLTVLAHRTEWAWPMLSRLVGPPTEKHKFPLRRVDPTCRLRGWKWLAAEVDQIRTRLKAENGQEPVLVGTSWNLPGALGVYCEGHPQAHSIGLLVGDRHSQYDLWPNSLDDPERYRGRTFIIVGGLGDGMLPGFRQAELQRELIYTENGHPIASWMVAVGKDFQGFPRPAHKGKHY